MGVISKCQVVLSKCQVVISKCQVVVSKCQVVVSKCQEVVSMCQVVISKCQEVVSKCQEVVSKCQVDFLNNRKENRMLKSPKFSSGGTFFVPQFCFPLISLVKTVSVLKIA